MPPRTFQTQVSVARIREHQRETGRDWAIVTLVSGVVLAANLALQFHVLTLDARIDQARLGVSIPESVEWIVLFAMLVVQFASGAAFVVGIKLWRDAVRRGLTHLEDLTLEIEDRRVTVLRGARVVHSAVELVAATAYPTWVELTVREQSGLTRFAVPLSPEEHRRFLAFLRDDGALALRERGSFVASFARTSMLHSTGAIVVHVLAGLVVLALAGAIVLALRMGR